MNIGARITTTRTCPLGFFKKGQNGTVELIAGDGSHLVRFDGQTKLRWVFVDEMRPVGERRVPVLMDLAMSWLNLRHESLRTLFGLLLIVVVLGLTTATLCKVAEIYRPNEHAPFLPTLSAVRG